VTTLVADAFDSFRARCGCEPLHNGPPERGPRATFPPRGIELPPCIQFQKTNLHGNPDYG